MEVSLLVGSCAKEPKGHRYCPTVRFVVKTHSCPGAFAERHPIIRVSNRILQVSRKHEEPSLYLDTCRHLGTKEIDLLILLPALTFLSVEVEARGSAISSSLDLVGVRTKLNGRSRSYWRRLLV